MIIKYNVIFTNKANKDLDKIYNYISVKLYAENSAQKLMKKIEKSILILEKYPFLYRKIFLNRINKYYRKIIINNFIVLYDVNEKNNQVIIHHIYYAKQDYLN